MFFKSFPIWLIKYSFSCIFLAVIRGYECSIDGSGKALLNKWNFNKSGVGIESTIMGNIGAAEYRVSSGSRYTYQYKQFPAEFYDKIYWIVSNGYSVLTPRYDGGFDYQFTPKSIPQIINMDDHHAEHYPLQINHTIYGRNGNTIQKFDLINDTVVIDLVTNPNMISFKVAGNNVFFTAYITATGIGTYKVDKNGNVELLNSFDMEIKIVQS